MPINNNDNSTKDGWNEWGMYVLKELERLNLILTKSCDDNIISQKEIEAKISIKFREFNLKFEELSKRINLRFEEIAIEQAKQRIKNDKNSKLFSAVTSALTLLVAVIITLL